MARASYGFSALFETMAAIRREEAESDVINDFAAGLLEYSVFDAEEAGLLDSASMTVATCPEDVADEVEGDSRLESLLAKIPEDEDDVISESVMIDFDKDVDAFIAGL